MSRHAAGIEEAIGRLRSLREEFWANVRVLGSGEEFNQSLEKAGRVADFLEFGELMARDALHREESCGGDFPLQHPAGGGGGLRGDENFAYAAAWEFTEEGAAEVLHKEPLVFEHVHLAQRSYK